MVDLIPKAAKAKMIAACRKVAKKVGKAVKPVDSGGKLEDAIVKSCKKEIMSIDKTAVRFFAEKLKEALDEKHHHTAGPQSVKKVAPKWVPKPPGSGVPSLTIPITEWVLDKKNDTKAKFSIRVWANPKDLKKSDKGFFVNFTVLNW